MNEKEPVSKPHLTAEEAAAALSQQLPQVLQVTDRDLSEIKHAMFYASECNHGTAGHNQLALIAKLAYHLGFRMELTDGVPVFVVTVPVEGVEIVGK
jgi:hypothetical protein